MPLSKKQINKISKVTNCIDSNEQYTEDQLREAVGLETDIEPITWEDVCDYVFRWFNKFSLEFKREARENYINELIKDKQLSKKEATEEVDQSIAEKIIMFILDGLRDFDTLEERYKILQQIKEGKFYEFINVNHLFYEKNK